MKILIADDDALIRDSLKILLEQEEDFSVIGTASDGQVAFRMCEKLNPDIVLMDIRMPVMDGVLSTKMIKEHFKDIKVIILTTFKDEEYIKEALKNGAEGYILKNRSAVDIKECIRTVSKGNFVLQDDIAKSLSGMIKTKSKKDAGDYGLTEREIKVLELIGQGQSNKEISETLYLSEGTVRNYVTSLLEKLMLRDRTQLAIFYLNNLT